MRERYNHKLEKLNSLMAEMCNLCRFAIENSVNALFAENNDESKKYLALVHNIDRDIDNSEGEIEKLCTNLIICEQPVASDLRTITVALKAVSDLERIGDHAADISEITIHLSNEKYIKKLEHINQMAKETTVMVVKSINAFVSKNLDMAKEVIESDDVVDELFDKVKNELIELINKDTKNGEQATDLLMIAKYFERIGDHATNIAEWVIFSKTGEHKFNFT